MVGTSPRVYQDHLDHEGILYPLISCIALQESNLLHHVVGVHHGPLFLLQDEGHHILREDLGHLGNHHLRYDENYVLLIDVDHHHLFDDAGHHHLFDVVGPPPLVDAVDICHLLGVDHPYPCDAGHHHQAGVDPHRQHDVGPPPQVDEGPHCRVGIGPCHLGGVGHCHQTKGGPYHQVDKGRLHQANKGPCHQVEEAHYPQKNVTLHH